MPFCPYCGELIVDDAMYCSHCGKKLAETKHEPQRTILLENLKFAAILSLKISGYIRSRDYWQHHSTRNLLSI